MECPFCEHLKAHKHSKTSNGHQRYRCLSCHQTFTDTLDTLYYRRQVTPEEIETILQAHVEGVSLRGIARLTKRAYNTVADVVRASSQKAQLVHNEEVKDVETDKIVADEMWSFVKKTKALHPRRANAGRRLDRAQFGSREWLDYEYASWQTHRCLLIRVGG